MPAANLVEPMEGTNLMPLCNRATNLNEGKNGIEEGYS